MVKAKTILANACLGLVSLPALAAYHIIKSSKADDFDFNEEGKWVNRAEEGRGFLSKWAHRIARSDLSFIGALALSGIIGESTLQYQRRNLHEFESESVRVAHYRDYDYSGFAELARVAALLTTNAVPLICVFDPPENERTRVTINGNNGSDRYSFTSTLEGFIAPKNIPPSIFDDGELRVNSHRIKDAISMEAYTGLARRVFEEESQL